MNGRSSGYSSIILAKTGDRNSRPTYFCKGGGGGSGDMNNGIITRGKKNGWDLRM